MIKTPYYRPNDKYIILVKGRINQIGYLDLLLDTGATHTTLDYNALAILGYQFHKLIKKVSLETANGIVRSELFLMDSFQSLGIRSTNFTVQILDFVKQRITSEYDGIIGLDFLAGTHFCIDTVQQQITIQ